MAEPSIAVTRLAGAEGEGELLLVGAGLGTSAEALWQTTARLLGNRFEVLGLDLPGHGRSKPATEPFTLADLASAVRSVAETVASGRPCWYAGVSMAGGVALELALDPGPLSGVAALAAAARFGEPADWHQRAALVRRSGTPVLVAGSVQRWFAPGFVERDGRTVDRLLHALSDADDESYALCCEALADFDLTERLGGVRLPLLLAPGEQDTVIPVPVAATTAESAPGAVLRAVPGCAHQPPAERPASVAAALTEHFEEAPR